MTSKWKRRAIAVAAGALALAAVCLLLLPAAVGWLVADQPADHFSHVAVLQWGRAPDGDRCLDAVADLHRKRTSSPPDVLLVGSRPDRLVELGLMPTFESICRRELSARGVPLEATAAISTEGRDDWATARTLRAWLAERPDASLMVLCDAFHSGSFRCVLDSVLDAETARRIHVRALPDRRFDPSNWWMNREGFKAVGIGWLMRLYRSWIGEGRPVRVFPTADQLEARVLKPLLDESP